MKIIEKEKAKKIIDDANVVMMRADKDWKYFDNIRVVDRDTKNCPMLDVMIEIEQKPGIVIYIPMATMEDE
jgi:uncharacterized protein YcsI (UPF0317 family)